MKRKKMQISKDKKVGEAILRIDTRIWLSLLGTTVIPSRNTFIIRKITISTACSVSAAHEAKQQKSMRRRETIYRETINLVQLFFISMDSSIAPPESAWMDANQWHFTLSTKDLMFGWEIKGAIGLARTTLTRILPSMTISGTSLSMSSVSMTSQPSLTSS